MAGFLDDLNRVVRERVIGSPPHNLQHLGTLEKINYIGTVGKISKLGTIATVGTVLLTIHTGTIGKVNRIGTLDEISGGFIGTVGYQRRLGTVGYVKRIGTLANLPGTVNRVSYISRIGTGGVTGTLKYLGTINRITYQDRLGTAGYLSRVGTVGRGGTTVVGVQYGNFVGTAYRRPIHLGQGSTWVGSWQHIGSFRTKTFSIMGRGTPGGGGIGSLSLITAVSGTGRFKTGTYYGPTRVGSYITVSFTEAMRYVRALVRKSGTYSGTVSMDMGLNPL